MKTNNIPRKIKKLRVRAKFSKAALLADQVLIAETAECFNISGKKENLSIGNQSSIMGSLHVHAKADHLKANHPNAFIHIGARFYLGSGACVDAHLAITIGDGVVISDRACVYDHPVHPSDPPSRLCLHEAAAQAADCTPQRREPKPVIIEDQVWIGQHAYIPGGVTVGEGSVVSPNAVVVTDVPPYTVVAGNPAKVIKMLQRPSAEAYNVQNQQPLADEQQMDKARYPIGQLASMRKLPSRDAYIQALFQHKRYTVDGIDAIQLMLDHNQPVPNDSTAIADEADRRYASGDMTRKTHGNTSVDSLLLAVVRIVTMIVGIATTMLLSRALSLEAYGTYSQGIMVMSVAVSFTTWGLIDAVNFFFNQKKADERQKYIDTVFAIMIGIGLAIGLTIISCQHMIVQYFDNPKLSSILLYVAFRPLLDTLINMLQVMYISIGKAKTLAVRNVFVSVCRLLFALTAAQLTNSTMILFVGQLLLDLTVLEYLWIMLFNENIFINPFKSIRGIIPEIFRFSIPMAMHTLIKVMLKDMDKLFIGRYEDTAKYALYANASSTLPFDLISNAFLLIIFPILTRYFAEDKHEKAREMVSGYLCISYITTLSFSACVLLLSKECVLFLYGEKYLPGTVIFMLYVAVDIVRIFNVSTILSAKGFTKMLMCISIGSVVLNFIFNYVAYWTLGFIGPAFATVLSTLITTMITCYYSGKALNTSFVSLLDAKKMSLFGVGLLATGAVSILLRNWLRNMHASYLLVLVTVGIFFIGTMLLLNAKNLLALFKKMNAYH